MINAELLEFCIKRSGKKKNYIAAQAGMTIQTFNRKINDKNDFTIREVMAICEELNVGRKEREKIFFN